MQPTQFDKGWSAFYAGKSRYDGPDYNSLWYSGWDAANAHSKRK